MKKEELTNGSIVVTRDGYLGVVIKYDDGDGGYILYQEIGMDDLDLFNDNLTSEDGEAWDIMEVFGDLSGTYSFYNIESSNPNPDWSRENGWQRPTPKEREARVAEFEKDRQQRLQQEEKMRRQAEERRKGLLSIITQAFYGNRTGTEIRPDEVDNFILGHLDSFPWNDSIDRTIIRVPDTEELVIIYNRFQEEKSLQQKEEWFREDGYVAKPLAVIPEIGLELYSRCIVCRQDPVTGELKSMQDEDYEIACRYLAE